MTRVIILEILEITSKVLLQYLMMSNLLIKFPGIAETITG